ncbi:hypothetical protein FBU31_007705, partial [Coemansia sp. 'formosensis']
MARGQIIAPQVRPPRPLSSSGMRKQALSMMKPLVTLSTQQDSAPVDTAVEPTKDALSVSPAESATSSTSVVVGNVSTAVDSASSNTTSISSRRGSCQSTTASDTDAVVGLLKNPRQRLSSKAGAVVGVLSARKERLAHTEDSTTAKHVDEITNQSTDQHTQQQEPPKQSAAWSTYSWLLRRASFASAGQHTPSSSDGLRKSAISHLRNIQGQQAAIADDVPMPEERQQQQNTGELVPTTEQLSGPMADVDSGNHGDLYSRPDVAEATDNVTVSNSRWSSWRWFGTGKSTAGGASGDGGDQ